MLGTKWGVDSVIRLQNENYLLRGCGQRLDASGLLAQGQ